MPRLAARRLVAPLLLAAFTLPAGASPVASRPALDLQHYGLDDGLSQNAVNAFAQDGQGFLWMATQDGLNRFDGQGFAVLRESIDERAGLSSSSVDALAIDDRQRLWIGTNDGGLDRLDLRTGHHEALGEAAAAHPTVQAIAFDGRGGAWLATPQGLAHLRDGDRAGTPVLNGAGITALVTTADSGTLALSADCGLWRLGADGATAIALIAPERARCVAMAPRGEGLVIATSRHGLLALDRDGQAAGRWPKADFDGARDELASVHTWRDGSTWIGTSTGRLFHLPAGPGGRPEPLALRTAIGAAVSGFFEDRDGGRWLATLTKGAFRIRALSAVVRNDTLALPSTLPNRSIRSLWRDASRTLVGTDAGLWLRQADGRWEDVGAFSGTAIRRITPSGRDGWWIGTHRGLWHLDADGTAEEADAPLPDPRVLDILVDDGGLLVATRGGLARFEGDTLRPLPVPESLRGLVLTALRRDVDGSLWVASNERGAFRWRPDGRVEQWHTGNGRLPHDSIWSLHGDADALWFGSFSGGLVRVERSTGAVRRYTDREGLSNNVVYRIEPDAAGRLWLSTNAGLSVLDPGTGITQRVDRGDGLSNREYNSGASTTDALGWLYFGGTEGVDVVDPAAFRPSMRSVNPAFARFRRLGHAVGSDPAPGFDLFLDDAIHLGHRDRVVAIDLVALDFDAPGTAQVRYRMAGVLPDWVTPGRATAEVLLAQVPPGTHVLEVEAAGRDGRFGPARALRIEISPPPWLSPAARAAYVVMALMAAFVSAFALRARSRRKANQIATLNRLVEERTAEIARANERLQAMNGQLQQLNRVAPLTRVANRREFMHWMEREGSRMLAAQASGDTRGALVFFMVDIDDFKRINDQHGHHAGDAVLVEFASRLDALRGPADLLVRWGGEEFLYALHLDDLETASTKAGQLCDAARGKPFALPSGQSLRVTCSVGFAPWPWARTWPTLGDSEQSIGLADRALYRVKAGGRNGWAGLVPGPDADRASVGRILAGETEHWPETVLRTLRSVPAVAP
ncbi:ligand-binding sensor domain-containing diguanylate cyclase [Silanimonas algicola]